MSSEWLSQKQFAERYGYASRTVSRWIKLNMPHIGRGKSCRIHVENALRWIEGGDKIREEAPPNQVVTYGDAAPVAECEFLDEEDRLLFEAAMATHRAWVQQEPQPPPPYVAPVKKRKRQEPPGNWAEIVSSDKKIHLREFAEKLGVKYATVKQWRWNGMPCWRGMVIPSQAVVWIEENRNRSIAFNRKSIIYFIRDQKGRIKIGLTSDMKRRLYEIRKMVGGPVDVLGTMPGDTRDEVTLHRRFAEQRLDGEWFSQSEELLAIIPSQEAA